VETILVWLLKNTKGEGMAVSKEKVESDLKDMLLKIIDVEPEDLKPNAHFYKDLGVDSIKAIEIAVAIEKQFKVSIKEEQLENVTTLSKAADLIYKTIESR
jgi:acyl carrier protein